MEAKMRVRWQQLVDAFDLTHLAGFQPWDELKVDALHGLSGGEEHVVCFLLGVWNPQNREWQHPRFDVIEALDKWDDKRAKAFLSWASEPFWP
jgi:hypothetical protein